MGIRFKRFPEYRLDLTIYDGVVSYEELLRHFEQRLEGRTNWLSYFGETAELSAIKVAHFPALKHAMTLKEAERQENEPARQALVNMPSGANVEFWRHYAETGARHPRERVVFGSLKAACEWLGVPPEGYEVVAAEIERGGEAIVTPEPASGVHPL